ncbi:MAG TPA: SURF1 family cytochrome oxidase biogenesis protein [Pseudonocardiaceae bacterium]|nr:SURF1 family cytochrome oxidase biogenesis protein [Pseudonocardiaceae bacterium]
MRRLSFLLRPGWIALVIVVIIFAGACFRILSPWQFGRNAERSAQNSEISTAVTDDAVPLRQLLPVGTEPSTSNDWREVTMSGNYLPGGETVARLRQVNDEAAYEILTPFRTDDGRIMLVDRGWVSPNNGRVPSYAPAPTRHVTLTARMHPEESNPHRPPLTEQGHREVYSVNTTVVSNITGLHVDPGYFTLVDNQPGVLNVLPLPQVDSGPFLSYAFQWIIFGLMALFGLGFFTWREIQPGGALTPEGRARRRAERAALAEETAKVVARGGKAAPKPKVRGRHAVAALIAEDEAKERETESAQS